MTTSITLPRDCLVGDSLVVLFILFLQIRTIYFLYFCSSLPSLSLSRSFLYAQRIIRKHDKTHSCPGLHTHTHTHTHAHAHAHAHALNSHSQLYSLRLYNISSLCFLFAAKKQGFVANCANISALIFHTLNDYAKR